MKSRWRAGRCRFSRRALARPRAGSGRGHPAGRSPGGRGPHPGHAVHLHAARGQGRLARAGPVPARAGPGERGPVADAGEAPAQRPRLRPDRARRLLRREGLLREPPGLLRHRQPLPAAGEAGPVSRGPLPARPLGLRPPRERRRRLDPGALHHPRPAGLRGLLLGHGRLQRLAPGGPPPPRRAPRPVGDRVPRAAPVEQHPLGGLPGVAPRRRQEPPGLHRGLRRRHADLPADRGGRPHQGLRPGQHDLALHAGRGRVRERAEPAPRHEQHGDRRAHGPAADADGLGGRRLDAGHAAHRVPRGPRASTSCWGRRTRWRPSSSSPTTTTTATAARRCTRWFGRWVLGKPDAALFKEGEYDVRAARGPAGLLRAGAAEGGEDPGADRRGPDRGPQGRSSRRCGPATPPGLARFREVLGPALRHAVAAELPGADAVLESAASSGVEGGPARPRHRAARPGGPGSGPALGAAAGSGRATLVVHPDGVEGASAHEASLVEPLRRQGSPRGLARRLQHRSRPGPARHERPLLHDLQPHGRRQPRAGHPHRPRLAEAAAGRPRGVPRRPRAGRAVVPPGPGARARPPRRRRRRRRLRDGERRGLSRSALHPPAPQRGRLRDGPDAGARDPPARPRHRWRLRHGRGGGERPGDGNRGEAPGLPGEAHRRGRRGLADLASTRPGRVRRGAARPGRRPRLQDGPTRAPRSTPGSERSTSRGP